MELHEGCKVIITANGSLGVLDPDADRRAFHPTVVLNKGDTAVYNGLDSEMPQEKDWHIVTYWVGNQSYDAPLHRDMFELACEDCEEQPARFTHTPDDEDEDEEHLCRDCIASR